MFSMQELEEKFKWLQRKMNRGYGETGDVIFQKRRRAGQPVPGEYEKENLCKKAFALFV